MQSIINKKLYYRSLILTRLISHNQYDAIIDFPYCKQGRSQGGGGMGTMAPPPPNGQWPGRIKK